ncbi:MBL fold metallo-hydrolase [Orbus sasakiae]|uniref:MBL fold metallo-hydrolase n=1 Tax=Orbus sasakiae TaxID=1078475 RepID=A0ABP9N4J9_9GAMM
MHIFISIIKWAIIIFIILSIGVYLFLHFHPVFGGSPDEQSLTRIHQSKAFDGQQFNNIEPTVKLTSDEDGSLLKWIGSYFTPPKGKNPNQPLPTLMLEPSTLINNDFVWFGHSTVLFKTENKIFITDPVFYNASPVPFTGNAFNMTHKPTIDELPQIDAVLISHDHYDHLDYKAIQKLDKKTELFVAPLGVKGHLQHWGIENQKIVELDWDEHIHIDNVTLTFVPARHFSGRRLNQDNPTLWGGYVVKSPDLSLYFSADSGYGTHYAERIKKYGPFDFAMIENGAYDKDWASIHEFPEQTLQAINDIGVHKILPIHWGKFDLANHSWKEPIERLLEIVKPYNDISLATPKIGQVFNIKKPLPNELWWRQVN